MSNPSSALERCTEESNSSKITVRAHGRVATFLNPDRARIRRVDLDCWLHSSKAAKADYLLCKAGVVDVIIELKGKDIDHAIEQILATLAQWKTVPSCSLKLGALIVFTRSPVRSATLDNIKLRLFEKHKIWMEMGKSGLRNYDFMTFTGTKR